MNRLLLGFVAFVVAATAVPALAGDREEVQSIKPRRVPLSVIDEKCLDCHNRKRIDEARSERKNIEEILRSMEKKGAAVSSKERQVIGHFWRQNPFRSN